MNGKMNGKRLARGLLFAVLAALALTVCGFVVTGLWNWLMPALFGWKALTFWQAIGLLVLSRLFFGGFRGRHGGSRHRRLRMIERWEQLTPEEKEKFRAGLRGHGGRCGHPATPAAGVGEQGL
jgi:hypothetical protein